MPRTENAPARVAVVTGAARGIGAAIAARLVADSHAVASLDVLMPDSTRLGILDIVCDISQPEAVEAALARVTATLGPPAVVVHCAAFQKVVPFDQVDAADWRRTFGVNVDGAFHLVRSALPGLRSAPDGRVIFITSSSYFAPPPGMAHYISTKGALTGLARALATELGGDGITVNCVAPGLTGTENALHDIPEQHFALVRSRQAVPRTGEPADIAAAVAFLASPDASFITGQTLLVDGGESRI